MQRMIPFLFMLLFFSCAEKVMEKPENLIPQDKMVRVLHDLALLNGMKSSLSVSDGYKGFDMMEFLFQRHKIDSTQFAESDLYYASKPLEYETIYKQVNELLTEKKKTFDDLRKKRTDSISASNKKGKDSTLKAKPGQPDPPDI